MTNKVPPPSQRPVVNPNNLRKIRDGLGLDVHDFVIHIGYIWRESNYYRVEAGTQMPLPESVKRLSEVLGLSIQEIMPCYWPTRATKV